MCGRYRLSRRKQIIGEHFDAVSGEEDWTPRYNIAPTQSVPIIRQHPKESVREISLARWGLIPSWSKDWLVNNVIPVSASDRIRTTLNW
jgi:putative SOS response-associated peptidase YedK